MLSYMLPVEDKPPPVPPKNHLQLGLSSSGHLGNGHTSTPMSKDNSFSSFASDVTTATASHSSMTPTSTSEKGKPKLIVNGAKHQSLKRVSFGSSKGSMVETLIFESPVQEEPEPSPIPENGVTSPFPEDQDQTDPSQVSTNCGLAGLIFGEWDFFSLCAPLVALYVAYGNVTRDEREKVLVKFFQQSKPQEVDLPDEPVVFLDQDFMMATQVAMNETNHIIYNRTESTESGWDNPFRPGGDLSREADEIVELIKGGKPITPTPGGGGLPSMDQTDNHVQEPITKSPQKASQLSATPQSANGKVKSDKPASPGALDVQRGTVKPDGDASQVEHVTIKKKPKCKCCVIQ